MFKKVKEHSAPYFIVYSSQTENREGKMKFESRLIGFLSSRDPKKLTSKGKSINLNRSLFFTQKSRFHHKHDELRPNFSTHQVKIGIFGGMGPIAGADFYYRLEKSIKGRSDAEHPIVYLYSNPTIRRKDISVEMMFAGNIPTLLINQLIIGLDFFKKQRVNFVVVPCNTFHFFLPTLEKKVDIPILNMIDIVADETIKVLSPKRKRIALLSTEATARSHIYQDRFLKNDISVELPDSNEMLKVSEIIELAKQGKSRSTLAQKMLCEVIDSFVKREIDTIILGCTELPLVELPDFYQPTVQLIDTTQCLINKTVDEFVKLKSQNKLLFSDHNRSHGISK